MCGRMTLTATEPLALAEAFALDEAPKDAPAPRYNIAPTQDVLVATSELPRRLTPARWGLIPSWAKDPLIGNRMINARAETVAEKPSFRAAFKKRRCLVAVDGWYEWRRTETGKTPFHFRRPDRRPFALGGLWETWRGPDGAPVRSATVLTTTPNAVAETIHDRMPVVVPKEVFDLWLAEGSSIRTSPPRS
jgi:putative SOS response-associated peptidase YedK